MNHIIHWLDIFISSVSNFIKSIIIIHICGCNYAGMLKGMPKNLPKRIRHDIILQMQILSSQNFMLWMSQTSNVMKLIPQEFSLNQK